MKEEKGVIIVFTGDGKGKTTAALGVALRASGHGMKTLMVQFMKGQEKSGEHYAGIENIEIHPFGAGFLLPGGDKQPHIEAVQKGWSFMEERVRKNTYQLLILDEIAAAMNCDLIPVKTVIDLLARRAPAMHVILTGRNMPDPLLDMADIVTEMKEVKHIFRKGVPAIEGLDY